MESSVVGVASTASFATVYPVVPRIVALSSITSFVAFGVHEHKLLEDLVAGVGVSLHRQICLRTPHQQQGQLQSQPLVTEPVKGCSPSSAVSSGRLTAAAGSSTMVRADNPYHWHRWLAGGACIGHPLSLQGPEDLHRDGWCCEEALRQVGRMLL